MKVDEVLGSILCSPLPQRVILLVLEKTAKGRTSSPWNCFRVGCAHKAPKATNFHLGETGREKSPDGVVPSRRKSQELSVCKGSLQNECPVKCTRKWAISSGEPVPCLPGGQGQQWAGVCAAAAMAHLLLSVGDSCAYLSTSVVCQHWTAPTSPR